MTNRILSLVDLKNRGRHWRELFADLEFIGELDVPEQDVYEICTVAGKHLAHSWNEDFRSALAVAVINIAYYASAELTDSFRWQVLKYLGYEEENTQLWEEAVGGPVLQILTKYFNEGDLPGPHRYVRPIMRQAGVPSRLFGKFAQFFRDISQVYSWPIPEDEFRQYCSSYNVLSPMLGNFLGTRAGWRYCCDVARVLKYSSLAERAETESLALPGFRGAILEKLRNALTTEQVRALSGSGMPRPKLVLDRSQLILAIVFSEKGLNGNYQWSNGNRVISSLYPLSADDIYDVLRGNFVRSPGQPRTSWEVKPWNPLADRWAVFLPSDGTFIRSSGQIRSGRYLLAIQEDFYQTLSNCNIYREYEDCGTLYIPGREDLAFRVVDADLPSGISINEIGFSVAPEVSANLPSLRFIPGVKSISFTTNVFKGRLPPVEILNWSPRFVTSYRLFIDTGSTLKDIEPKLFENTSTFTLPPQFAAQAKVILEPKGRSPRGFVREELPYAVLPANVDIRFPRGLRREGEELNVAFDPADKFTAVWDHPASLGDTGWTVPPRLRAFRGQVTYDGSITFPISGEIYRLRISGEIIERQILWVDKLKLKCTIQMDLSPEESGKHINLGLQDGARYFPVANGIGPVKGSGRLSIPTSAICDAFDSRRYPAARLAIELPSSTVVISDIFVLNEEEIIRRTFDDNEHEFGTWITCVPDELKSVLIALRDLPKGQLSVSFPDVRNLPRALAGLIVKYFTYAGIFDEAWGLDALESLSGDIQSFMCWFINARSYVNSNQGYKPSVVKTLLEEMPSLSTLSKELPRKRWKRWRDEIAKVIRTLRGARGVADVKRRIAEWSRLCRNEQWETARLSSIGRTNGGPALIEATRDYRYALEWKIEGDRVASSQYFHSAESKLKRLREDLREGLVYEIAVSLSVMIYYHLKHPQLEEKASEATSVLGEHWQNFKCLTRLLGEARANDARSVNSIGLADFSPSEQDVQLEKAIFYGK